ncbi:hypothetical protein T261_8314 [Streptomyces lydicus]|nr:hypothetical protein T261_8314 [Streptomyces lydicus]
MHRPYIPAVFELVKTGGGRAAAKKTAATTLAMPTRAWVCVAVGAALQQSG